MNDQKDKEFINRRGGDARAYRELRNIKTDLYYYLFQKKRCNAIGSEYINKPLTEEQYSSLCGRLYGNQYLKQKYDGNIEQRMRDKTQIAELIDCVLNPNGCHMKVLDAGANKGYQMKAFLENWTDRYDVYGFDILEDLDQVVDSQDDIIRKHYKIGSILDIPQFHQSFDIVISTDVFEHIPINKTDIMADQLTSLRPRFFAFQISKDAFNDGHITLKGTHFWISKFKGYHLMKEAVPRARRIWPEYEYSGIPVNGWNKVPGFVFLVKD